MPRHTPAERKKRGIIQRARDIVTEKFGGFKAKAASEATQRSSVSSPFTGASGQRERRQSLIGRSAPKAAPIIKPVSRKVDGSQTGNLSQGIDSVRENLRRRKRQLENTR